MYEYDVCVMLNCVSKLMYVKLMWVDFGFKIGSVILRILTNSLRDLTSPHSRIGLDLLYMKFYRELSILL